MSFQPSDTYGDHDDVICGCGIVFDHTTTLSVCAHLGCETAICEDCLMRCECCPGKFCAEHVSATTDGTLACSRCESIDLLAEDLLEREADERRAMVARMQAQAAPTAVITAAIIRHAEEVRI